MKTTKILLGALRISALIALFAVAMPAKAQTVNVNFNGNGDTYTGTGAASDMGTYWNSATSAPFTAKTFSPLLNSTGGSSTVAVTMTNPDTANPYDASVNNPAPFANPLLSDEFYGQTATIELTGLTAGATYNLYLYSENGGYNSNLTTFTFGTAKTVSNGGSEASFVNGGNYVEFTLVANGLGDITGTENNAVNGLQVQFVSAPVGAPEPASLATMSLVGMALLMFCKRFKKQSV